MWSQKLKSGNVCYYERYKDPLTGKTKTATVTIKPTRKKADERAAHEILREKIQKFTEESTMREITLAELCEKYNQYILQSAKPQTAIVVKSRMRTITSLIGSDVIASRLTAPIVRDRLHDDSASKFNGRLKYFKAMIRWAYKADYLADISYIDKIEPMKEPPARLKDADKYLEHDEISALLDGMGNEKWRLLTEFLILSGLRVGEAFALNDSDVDLVKREIRVNKTYSHSTHRNSTTKTDTSERVIYMQDELFEVCRKIKAEILTEKMRLGYRSKIFIPNADGKHLIYVSYYKYITARSSAAIGREISPHALRHTHVSLLAESGMPLDAIMRRVGHANSKITREVYLHTTEKMKERDREVIKNVKMLDIC